LCIWHAEFTAAIEEEFHSFDFSPLANYSTILAKVEGNTVSKIRLLLHEVPTRMKFPADK